MKRTRCIRTQGVPPPRGEGDPAVGDDRGGPGGHYAQRHKPDTERQVLTDVTCVWTLKRPTPRRREQKVAGQRLWGQGLGVALATGAEFRSREMPSPGGVT